MPETEDAQARLPYAARAQTEAALYLYPRTVAAIKDREDAYLCLSGEGEDPDMSLRRARNRICWSDPTRASALLMAADRELQAWRAQVAAIDAARDAMPVRMQDALALCFWSRGSDGSVRRAAFVAAALGLSLADYGRLRRRIVWRVAVALRMVE